MYSYLLSATLKDQSITIHDHEDNVNSATVTPNDIESNGLRRTRRWEEVGRSVVKYTMEAEDG